MALSTYCLILVIYKLLKYKKWTKTFWSISRQWKWICF